MLFVTDCKLKAYLKKDDVKRLMDEFGKRGASPGELTHYARIDGSGGFTIGENDDLTAAYENVLAYTEFMTFTVTPVLAIGDAVGPILSYAGQQSGVQEHRLTDGELSYGTLSIGRVLLLPLFHGHLGVFAAQRRMRPRPGGS